MPRSPDAIREELHRLIAEYFEANPFALHEKRLPLVAAAYGKEEVTEALDALLSSYVTMGKRVFEFEAAFARRVGTKHAILVNSGSSANLLALSVLSNPALKKRIQPGDEIIVPAVTWSTTVWPIIQVGAVPVLVDVSLETLCMDAAEVEKALTPKTRAILPVHLLGNGCDMKALEGIAKKRGLFVIEDTCEALGTEIGGKVAGTFGDFGTYSFYFSHHITTIEGGMVITDDDALADLARVLRAHGWSRNLPNKEEVAAQYPDIDPRFLFVNTGYNFRATEIQGAFGLHQLKRLDPFNNVRRRNAGIWAKRLAPYEKWLQTTRPGPGVGHTWFAFPFLVREEAPFRRRDLVEHLESHGIETRPIVAGNLARQPAFRYFDHRISGKLPNAEAIMDRGLFFGNHGVMSEADATRVGDCLEEFLARHS